MAESPAASADGPIKLTISCNGTVLDDLLNVIVSVEIRQAFNKVPTATLMFLDGDMPNQDFPLSNQTTFQPGSEITISAGYGQKVDQLFQGVVLKHSIAISGKNDARLVIECKDKAVAMTVGRKNANYLKQKDSDILSTIIGTYTGLSAQVKATTTKYSELVQYNCTDWDFMLSRAEINGMLVNVVDGKVNVGPPQVTTSPVLTVTYGLDLFEFNADLDATNQLATVDGVCWNPSSQKVSKTSAGPKTLNKQGDLSSTKLAKTLGVKSYRLQTPVPLQNSALKDWAAGQQVKSGLARIQGHMVFQGDAKAKVDSLIQVAGVGKRFNGNLYVSGVQHTINHGQWVTEVDFGMPSDWFADNRDLVSPPASGLTPGVEGLQVGVVMKLDADPDKQDRIQVSVPVSEAKTKGVWARLANFYASKGFGDFFIPEIGDEVVLGYFNNDPSNPVILGSLYSSNRKPPYKLTATNDTKAIVTRSKLKVEFNEKDKITTIITPGNNQIVLSDKDKSILVQDMNKNKVLLDPNGITMDSPKDIQITAQGKISVQAQKTIDIKATSDVTVSGANITNSAQSAFTGKGSTSELSASGNTTVKGSKVYIN